MNNLWVIFGEVTDGITEAANVSREIEASDIAEAKKNFSTDVSKVMDEHDELYIISVYGPYMKAPPSRMPA
ncbi:MAG: hypothetical protein ACXABY_02620 [Candidatus Thorarchaeota archaeon]|jgi:hypothetical protein